MIALCSVDPENTHLVEVPFYLAMIEYQIDDGVVMVAEEDAERAVRALYRFGHLNSCENE